MNCFSEKVLEQANKNPHAIAVVDQNGTRETSYADFVHLAFQFAHCALAQSQKRAIITLPRGMEYVAAIVGLNLANVAFAPLTAKDPASRVDYIQEQLGTTCNVNADFLAQALQFDGEPFAPLPKLEDDIMFVYTSGSTGKPKGVFYDNYSINKAIERNTNLLAYSENSIYCVNATFSFSAIQVDLLTPLCAEHVCLHISTDEVRKDYVALKQYINKHKCTHTFFPPQILMRIGDDMPSLVAVITGSERIANIEPRSYRISSAYAMTESTVLVTSFELDKSYDNTPIGKPMAGMDIYLLDENDNPAEEGEICIAGPVAKGYVNLPELTAKTFIPNPFAKGSDDQILLRTGDLGKRLPDGNYLYLNRKDWMLKIDGQRVEPGEIESVIKTIPQVEQAVVKGFVNANNQTYLCAYYTQKEAVSEQEIRQHIASNLPVYMQPKYFVALEALPINANGKVDRTVLHSPEDIAKERTYEAPQDAVEERLCNGFAHALEVDLVGRNDDFFMLGGDSIKTAILINYLGDHSLTATDILIGKTPVGIKELMKTESEDLFANLPKAAKTAPLTNSQMGIYLEWMQRPDSMAYNIPMCFAMDKSKDLATLKQAVNACFANHMALFSYIIHTPDGANLVFDHIFDLCEELHATEAEMDNIKNAFVKPFDLSVAPMCRAKAVETEDHIYLLLDVHHIVFDGSSMAIFADELGKQIAGEPIAPESLNPFNLYEIEKRTKASPKYAEDKAYYDGIFASLEIDSSPIPDKKPLEDAPFFAGQKYLLPLGEGLGKQQVEAFAKATKISESTLFMTAFGYTLAKFTAQPESVFSVATSGRNDKRLADCVSMLVKTIPIYMSIDETTAPTLLLQRTQEEFYQSLNHDSYPYTEMVQSYDISPDVKFVYQSNTLQGIATADGLVPMGVIETGHAIGKLSCMVFKTEDGYLVQMEYRSDIYNESTIQRIADTYAQVLQGFLTEDSLASIHLASETDVAMYTQFNKTEMPYDESKTIVDLFLAAAKQYPDNIAAVYKEKTYTYKQLDEITDRLAQYITNLGIGTEDAVSILIERNEFMPICAIGVVKSGAGYQPLDPSYPPERIAFMMEDSNAKLLIAQENLLSIVPEYKGATLLTHEIESLEPTPVPLHHPKPEDLLVLLYTSGSTGVPKGCMLDHKGLTAFVASHTSILEMDATSNVSAYASFGFDASVMDIFSPLSVGATLQIIPDEIRLDLDALVAYCNEHKMSHMFMTTQVARQFIPYLSQTPTIKCLSTGGETLSPVSVDATAKLYNLYGPTEATVYVTHFHVDQLYDNVPIGKATRNTKLYVIDSNNRLVPIGVPGELVISGRQVARGYLGRPEKTAEVFTTNPFCDHPNYNRIYHTGDIVRMLENGNVEFVGRRDSQVKIRGFRIELSEVETVIKEYPAITDVTVIAKDAPSGGKMLHAYIVSDETIDINALNEFILGRKPAYIVPAATMQIDAIPLTPNFKVDKRKLPEISTIPDIEEDSTKTLTRMEQELKAMVAKIVGHENFGLTTNLGLAGLSSISSMKFASELMKVYGYSPDVRTLSKNQTILSLEEGIVDNLLGNLRNASAKPQETHVQYPLSQSQLGIYLSSMSPEGMATYNVPLLLQLPQNVDLNQLKQAVKSTIEAHPSMLCFVKTDASGEPYMYPQPDMPITIEECDWDETDLPKAKVYQFGDHPLFSVRLLHGTNASYLLLEVHHIIGDGESVTLLMGDIDRAYHGETISKESYTAFALAEDEEEKRKTSALAEAKAYYDSVFKGVSVDVLPSADVFDQEPQCKKIIHRIGDEQGQIVSFCKEQHLTENAFFTSAFAVLLGKYSASEETMFNVIHNGRTDPRCLSTVGMFVKTMPVYCALQNDVAPKDFIEATHVHLEKLKENNLYSYAEVSHAYGVKNDILFAYQGKMLEDISFCDNPLQLVEIPPIGVKSPINVDVFMEENGFRVEIEYNSGIYSHAFMESFVSAYETCIGAMTTASTLGTIGLLDATGEQHLKELHDTSWDVAYRPVYSLLERSAEANPSHTAVVASGHSLTYDQLNQEANRIGHLLQNVGVGVNDIVGLMLHRTHYVYIARQGILKSGGAFLSIDPTYPQERVSFMLQDAKVKALILTRDVYVEQQAFIDSLGLHVIFVEEVSPEISGDNLHVDVPENALAYCIYTSGSTGTPKGVMLTQRNLINFVDDNPKNHETLGYIQHGKVSLALASITFDVSIMEEFIPLAHGLTICMANLEEIHNPMALRTLCLENGVDIISCTPSFLLNILDLPELQPVIAQLKSVDFGAEAFPNALYQGLVDINPDLYIMNGYGPTEATISCTMGVVTQDKHITIGTPNANVKVAIVDANNQIMPMGALGELVILGAGVGKGYVGRPDLTEKVFTTIWDMPAYKSGDFARILPSGEIEFRGRVDNQVKLRGLRVELGEIETKINQFEGVKTSIVVMKESAGGQYLAGYFTADHSIDVDALTAHLSENLTAYMVPNVLMQLDSFPLTANRKIDKKALPETQYTAKQADYVAPINEIETEICAGIAKILGLERVGAMDHFFELGGTSLSASKLAMLAMSKGYPLVYADIFANPTPRAMAAICANGDATQAPATPVAEFVAETEESTLLYNQVAYVDGITKNSIGNLLLTGATGFLGIHVLKNYLDTETGKVYCLTRKGNSSSVEKRLMNMLAYYFEDPMEELFGERIFCVEGSITSKDSLEQLGEIPFDTLINCAAIVKHFVYDDSLTRTNVDGVKNLIAICKKYNKRLIQVSTVSIAGEGVGDDFPQDKLLHENEFFFGQALDNAYIKSKFLAEEAVLQAISEGLDGKIMRVGNLMPRANDGEFQINCRTNGFMRQLRGYKVLGCFPVGFLSMRAEFSPIDTTAAAIIALSGTDKKYTVFHPYNNHIIYMADVIQSMVQHGMEIKIVSDEVFQKEMMIALGDDERNAGVSGLVAYSDNSSEKKYMIDCVNDFTNEALYRLNFLWPITEKAYLERSFAVLDHYGFFDYFI